MINAGVNVSLGTDGAASNNDLNMFEEMDITAKLHKVFNTDSTVMKAKTVLEMATINGAKTLGLSHKIGSLEEGKQADIIICELKMPHLVPLYNPYSHIVYAMDASDVEIVIIDGKIIMENYKVLTAKEDDIISDVIAFSKKIKNNN